MMSFLVDSNVFVEALKGNPEAESLLSGLLHSSARVFINDVVFSEVFYHYLRLKAGPYWRAKKNPDIVKSAVEDFEKIVLPLLAIPDFLEINYDVSTLAVRLSRDYGLLPNDALLLATVEYYGIGALVSLDSDFADACEKEGVVLVSSAKDLEEYL
ncbi:PIN domain-containing protein [Thermococcus sp. M36]|uniref:type II toxin-antitoxin system VapC family toxin n=1 Tax=Thermococcus sp. M36 TaxID=1638261 RepID=UPI00143BDD24|nr:type II toxin-antitoxin system VapC family toxin [Thermococcus sp. M36]NJE06130.1 PIN domain-containing protein [Thermococcus sp. M36]